MQTPTRMDKVVIKDYYHMIKKMNENVNWMEVAHLLSKSYLNRRAPFCACTFTSTFLIAYLNVHIRVK